MRSLGRRSVPLVFAVAALLGATAGTAAAADNVDGTVGPYRTFDTKADPSTLCAYSGDLEPRIEEFRVRGPRVDMGASIGEVGWVEWHVVVQRRKADGTWKTLDRTDPIRRVVTLGFSRTFPTMSVPFQGPVRQARIRLLSRLAWFDQGDTRTGGVRHVVRHYGWVVFGEGDPIRFDDLERKSIGSCPNLYTL